MHLAYPLVRLDAAVLSHGPTSQVLSVMFVSIKGTHLSLKQEASVGAATFDPSIDALSTHSAMPEPDSGTRPSTLNPQPSILNPQPSTLNPQPSTLNPQPIY